MSCKRIRKKKLKAWMAVNGDVLRERMLETCRAMEHEHPKLWECSAEVSVTVHLKGMGDVTQTLAVLDEHGCPKEMDP